MRRILLVLAGFWLFAALSFAQPPEPFNPDVPDRYVVKKGDTLWDIAAFFLRKPWLWPEIWHVNPQIANPHLIYPGDEISLIYVDGRPRLTLNRGREVKLGPQVRVEPHGEAVPALPLDIIDTFLSRTRVVAPGELEAAPHVVAGQEKSIIVGAGDDFYVRGEVPAGQNFWGVYRNGGNYVDPETGEILGVRAQDIGSGKLKAVNGEVLTLAATRSVEEIRIGDRILPVEDRKVETVFYPSAPPIGTEGVIMAVEGGIANVGHLDVVAINRGAEDGIEIGDTLAIHKAGEVVRDRIAEDMVTLPPERAGLLMVFRTFEQMSFGLVMHASRPLQVGDLVREP
ncbi:MAG: LysM peptidoglycan-binding domain-containing protein [Pseudomonadota bacterium]